jgi:nucleotide-binding universal stress UspA family protein
VNDVLLPIEEGRDASAAVRRAIALNRETPVRVHLLNVRTPLPSYVARFIPAEERQAFHHENGITAMRAAIAQLDEAGVAHRDHVLVGDKAETIVNFAHETGCSHIIIAPPAGLLDGLGLGSVAAQLRRLVPPGDRCSILDAA